MTHRASNGKIIRIAVLLLLFLFIYRDVNAEVLCGENAPPEIHGRIVKGDFLKLLVCLRDFVEKERPKPICEGEHARKPIGWVYFNSVGGDENEAIKIGRFLREGLAEVAVKEKCSGACFLALVGAVKVHQGEHSGEVGIRRIFFDEGTLKQTDIKDYKSYYKKLKKEVREYCDDMDVPTPIVENMFSASPGGVYILTDKERLLLGKHPAYDEWINAKCPDGLSGKEQEDYSIYVSSDCERKGFSEEYIKYLEQKNSEYVQCVDDMRWRQFRKTITKYSENIH